MVDQIEQFCDRYFVIEELGCGGFSRTFLARDLEMVGYPLCVVKCLTLDAANEVGNIAELRRQLIVQEARILERFKGSTANVPRILACPEHHHPVYLVEEYIEGQVLEVLKQQPFSEAQVVSFLHNVLSVLEVIHRHSVVHQDIKPSNLIRRNDGSIAVIDFGAAIDLDEFVEDSSIYGTPGYSPLEQQDGKIDFHTDLYALGMTAIELLSGVAPQQLERHPSSGKLQWQQHLGASIHPKVAAILDRLVALRPADRYTRAIDVLADLQQLRVESRLAALPNRIGHSVIRSILQAFQPIVSKCRSIQSQSLVTPTIFGLAIICGFGFVPLLPRMTDTIAAQMSMIQNQPVVDLSLIHKLPLSSTIDQFLVVDRQLVTFNRNNQVQVWDLSTGKVQQGWTTPGMIEMLTMTRNHLVSQRDESLTVWQLSTGNVLHQIALPEPANTASLSADGQHLATVSPSHTLRVWNMTTGKLLRTVPGITTAQYAPDNRLFCATTRSRIDIWDAEYTQLQQSLAGHLGNITAFNFSENGIGLTSTASDGTIVWNLETSELLRVLPTKVRTAAILPNYLVTQHEDGTVRLLKSTGKLVKSLAYLQSKVAMTANAHYVVQITPQQLEIWQLSKTEP